MPYLAKESITVHSPSDTITLPDGRTQQQVKSIVLRPGDVVDELVPDQAAKVKSGELSDYLKPISRQQADKARKALAEPASNVTKITASERRDADEKQTEGEEDTES